MDNKTNPNSSVWQKVFWQIRFAKNGGEWRYIVASNTNRANLNQNESVLDPANGKYLHTSDAIQACS